LVEIGKRRFRLIAHLPLMSLFILEALKLKTASQIVVLGGNYGMPSQINMLKKNQKKESHKSEETDKYQTLK